MNLSEVPDEIGQLTSLKEVDLRVIQFQTVKKKEYQGYFQIPKIYFSNSCNCSD